MKSLVRVHTEAKRVNSPEFEKAVKEFVSKMGGANLVIGAILRSQPNSNELLFDNSVIFDDPNYSPESDEDLGRCL